MTTPAPRRPPEPFLMRDARDVDALPDQCISVPGDTCDDHGHACGRCTQWPPDP